MSLAVRLARTHRLDCFFRSKALDPTEGDVRHSESAGPVWPGKDVAGADYPSAHIASVFPFVGGLSAVRRSA
jgi:hypothetical protein